MLPENHTDKIQHIDGGCGQMMKLKIAAAMDSWLEKEDNLDKMAWQTFSKGQMSLNDSEDWGGIDWAETKWRSSF